MFACGLRQCIAFHYEWFFISSLTFDLHWTPQETRKPDYIFCQNDSKRLRGTGAFLNSAIILKLVWHEKVNLYFEIIFFQKPLLFPSKSVRGAQDTSSRNGKILFAGQVWTTEIKFQPPASTQFVIWANALSRDSVTKLAGPWNCQSFSCNHGFGDITHRLCLHTLGMHCHFDSNPPLLKNKTLMHILLNRSSIERLEKLDRTLRKILYWGNQVNKCFSVFSKLSSKLNYAYCQ